MRDNVDVIIKYFIKNFEKFVIAVIIVFPFLIIGAYYSGVVQKAPVREDAVGYYSYLPAFFIHKDLMFKFMIDEEYPYTYGENTFEKKFNPSEAKTMGFSEVGEDIYLDKYPIGVAVLLIPFFLLGHILTLFLGEIPNGWSFFYQYSCFYGGIVYFCLGLHFLKKILLKYFSIKVTFLTLIAIVFGTNLFNYAFFENVFSHIYSFFLITLFLYLLSKWSKYLDLKNSVLLGINLGLIVLVRPTNFLIAAALVFYNVMSLEDLQGRVKNLLKNFDKVIILILAAFLIFIPQLLYWKAVSGNFLTYSYEEEGFLFLQPKLFKVLFGSSKGLFFWSPILLSAVIGLFLMKNKSKKYQIGSIIIIVLQIYLVSSWWNWEYGWSFGHRAFTDFLGIFALGLASFYSAFKSRVLKIIVLVITFLLIFLSCFQMIQYWMKILPPARTTLDDYFRIFLSLDSKHKLFWRKYFVDE